MNRYQIKWYYTAPLPSGRFCSGASPLGEAPFIVMDNILPDQNIVAFLDLTQLADFHFSNSLEFYVVLQAELCLFLLHLSMLMLVLIDAASRDDSNGRHVVFWSKLFDLC